MESTFRSSGESSPRKLDAARSTAASRAASRRVSVAEGSAIPDWKARGVTISIESGLNLRNAQQHFYSTVVPSAMGPHPQAHPEYVNEDGSLKPHVASNSCKNQPGWADLGKAAVAMRTPGSAPAISAEEKATRTKAARLVGADLEWSQEICRVEVPKKTAADGTVTPATVEEVPMDLSEIVGGYVNRSYPSGPGVINTGINTAADPVIHKRNEKGQMLVLAGSRTDAHIHDFATLTKLMAEAGMHSVEITINGQAKSLSIAELASALDSVHVDFAAGMKDDAARGLQIKAFLRGLFGDAISDAYSHGKQADSLTSRLLLQLSKTVILAAKDKFGSTPRFKEVFNNFDNPVMAILGGGMDGSIVRTVTDPANASKSPVEQKIAMMNTNASNEIAEEGGFGKGADQVKMVKDKVGTGITRGTIDVRCLGFMPCDDQRGTKHAMVSSQVISIDVTDDQEFQDMFKQKAARKTGFEIRLAGGSQVQDDELSSGDDVMNTKWVPFDASTKWFASHGSIGTWVHADAADKNRAKIERLRQDREGLVAQLAMALPVGDGRAVAQARTARGNAQKQLEAIDAKIKVLSRYVSNDEKQVRAAGVKV